MTDLIMKSKDDCTIRVCSIFTLVLRRLCRLIFLLLLIFTVAIAVKCATDKLNVEIIPEFTKNYHFIALDFVGATVNLCHPNMG